MNNYDYIVLIDENGQPYIAHSWRDKVRSAPAAAKNAGRQAVKYIEKIVDKGKTRYFYTQDELKAFYNNTRNRASNAVNQAKNTARRAAENAGRAIDQATGLGVRKDLNTAEKRLEESRRKADREQRRMEQAGRIFDATADVRDAKKDELDQVKSVSEYDQKRPEVDRWQANTHDQFERMYGNEDGEGGYYQRRKDAEKKVRDDESAVDFLKDIYADTPLGRIENAAAAAKNAFSDAKDTVSRWGSTTLDSIGSAVDSAKNAVTNAIKDPLGYGAKERAEQARKNADRADSEFWENADRALTDFNRRGSDRDSDTWKNADAAGERRQADMDKAMADYSRYSDEYIANKRAYQNSPAAAIDRATDKVKTITASVAKSLQEKWAAGKELTQTEMNQLMSFLMKDYK